MAITKAICCCFIFLYRAPEATVGSLGPVSLFSQTSLEALPSVTVDKAATLQSSTGASLVKCSIDCALRSDCIGFYFRGEAGACRLLSRLVLSSNTDDLLYMKQAGYGEPGIISLNKPAWQSTTYDSTSGFTPGSCCNAGYAFDGDINTFAHTEGFLNQWIAVDLGWQYVVSMITVTARCHSGFRAKDYDLRVGSIPTPVSGFFNGSLCAHFIGEMEDCQTVNFTCPCSTVGRYVSIQIMTPASNGDDKFNLAEMAVYGALL